MVKIFLLWLPMILIAMLNGIFRGVVLLKLVNEITARQISSMLLIALLGIYIWLIYHKLEVSSYGEALKIGIVWMILTVLFETGLGIFVSKLSIEQILVEYNIFKG